MYFNKIDGDRIYLSPVNHEDAPIYCKWLNDPLVAQGIGGLTKVYSVLNEESFLENVEKSGDYIFAIILKDGNKLIGNCGIHNYNSVNRTATLGIFIGEEEYRSKGYGTEVIKLLIDYGFNILNLNNIDLKVFSFNERAIACYKKCGLKEYGRRHNACYMNNEYHDEVFMEILRENYYNN